MAWRDEMLVLRKDVETAVARQLGEDVVEDPGAVQDRAELYQLAASLQIAQLLLEMNEVVLSGTGRVECTSLMDYYDDDEFVFEMEDLNGDGSEDDEEDDDFMEDGEELRCSLFWDAATECAIDVELGKSQGRIYLLVNGEEVRQSREVLETAVIDAFRSELSLETE